MDLIARNFKRMSEHASGCALMAVLKANAYGLGVEPIAECLKQAGAAAIGVTSVQEALPLLRLGLSIWIVSALLPDEAPVAVELGLVSAVADIDTAKRLSAEALRQGKTALAHAVIDTGMGRVGFQLTEAVEAIAGICALPGLQITGLGSHFPDAAGDSSFSNEQVDEFIKVVNSLEKRGLTFAWRHMANSDALHAVPRALVPPFNMARTGLNLYGMFAPTTDSSLHLEPVMSFKTRLIAARRLSAGRSIGYCRTHRLTQDTTVGTLALGYADGLPFALANRGFVLIRGAKCPILGRVSMDYTTVSLENVPDAQPGEEVTCLGPGVPITGWAELKGTIPYEIFCAIGRRVERRYMAGPHVAARP